MPITKSAIKALRKDKRKAKINKPVKIRFQEAVKKARKKQSLENIKQAYKALDKAAKKRIIHKKNINQINNQI